MGDRPACGTDTDGDLASLTRPVLSVDLVDCICLFQEGSRGRVLAVEGLELTEQQSLAADSDLYRYTNTNTINSTTPKRAKVAK